MAALKFCQSQLTGDPLVCWELVSGVISAGALTGTSVCVFRRRWGWDRVEVLVLRFTPQLWITWQGKGPSHSRICGGKGSLWSVINHFPCRTPRINFGGNDRYYCDMASNHLNILHHFPTIIPESHTTSLVFTVPPWGKQVLLSLYKKFCCPLGRGADYSHARQTFPE